MTIDLQEFEENTIYTLKYHLYSSTMVSDRKVSSCGVKKGNSLKVVPKHLRCFSQKEVLP